MKRYLFVLLILAASHTVWATNPESTNKGIHFKGIVVDKISGETLAGVKVTIDGTNLEVYTDFNGEFEFDGLTEGTYKINCSFITYNEMVTAKIQITTENESKPLILKIAPEQTPEIKSVNRINLG
jgi:hypothetical protein